MFRIFDRFKRRRQPRTRFFSNAEFERLGEYDPYEMARSEIADYAELMAEMPDWDFLQVCHQFAMDSLRFLEDPHPDSAEVERVCAAFREYAEHSKGIFGLLYLHDYLLEQVSNRCLPP